MMVVMLHSNGQLKSEGDDDIERMSETCFTAEHLLTDNVTRTRSRNLESGALNLVCQRFCLRACV